MFLAIVGTCFSGKTTLEEYFVSRHRFTRVQIRADRQDQSNEQVRTQDDERTWRTSLLTPTGPQATEDNERTDSHESTGARHFSDPLQFPSPQELLQYVTRHWRQNFVTVDLATRLLVEIFVRRPFFMLLQVDAPILTRFGRSLNPSLEDFVRSHDGETHLKQLTDLIDVQIENSFTTLSELHQHLDSLNLLDPELLRPGWDAYFMTLASLASQRSNCMKRRVGAVLVKDNRVVSTGYNGTPRGLTNCNEGGCPQCNVASTTLECVCLHAEENALLEAGRERVGANSVLYCNTCPCLKCTVKIIQTGVQTVVYNLTYKVDDASAGLFKEAGVELRRYDPNKRSSLQVPTSLQGPRFPFSS